MKNRSEFDKKFQWATEDIFATKNDWEAAFSEVEALIPTIAERAGKSNISAEELKKTLDIFFEASQKEELIYIYAMLHKDSDGGNPEYQEMQERAIGMMVKLQSAAAYLEPEILNIAPEKLTGYMSEPYLKKYAHTVESITRMRDHILESDKELLLSKMSDASGTPSGVYGMLTNVDMEFPEIKDDDGNDVKLTHGNFGVYRESKNREVREGAFRAFFGEYKRYINTLAALYSGSVKFDNYYADIRNFGSACEKGLNSNNVPLDVYNNLIEAIHESLPSMRKYIELRKKVMKLDKIDMFDMYVPIVADVDFDMPYSQGCSIVKEALKPLGDDYVSVIEKAMTERWIDVYENKGKRSGAYSCGVYGVHPYVLLNYTDKLDDAFTLAHELGHAMHSYLSGKSQEYCNADYKIMVAEVASTVNEVLLTMHLLKNEPQKDRRAAILNHLLEGFRTTVYRQTLFAEFEKKAHELQQAGTPLTAKMLSDLYYSLVKLYYDGADADELVSYEWSYIPHFYTPFYVYQYATGFCSAVAIVKNILETGNADNYLRFLSLGGSDYPLEELKVAGIDLTKPDTVKNALAMFDETIDELEKLLS